MRLGGTIRLRMRYACVTEATRCAVIVPRKVDIVHCAAELLKLRANKLTDKLPEEGCTCSIEVSPLLADFVAAFGMFVGNLSAFCASRRNRSPWKQRKTSVICRSFISEQCRSRESSLNCLRRTLPSPRNVLRRLNDYVDVMMRRRWSITRLSNARITVLTDHLGPSRDCR